MVSKKTISMSQEDLEKLKQDLMKDMKKEKAQPTETGGNLKEEVKPEVPKKESEPVGAEEVPEETPAATVQDLHDNSYFRYLLLKELRYINIALKSLVEKEGDDGSTKAQ